MEVKSLPPEAKPTVSLEMGMMVISPAKMGLPTMVLTSAISRSFCIVVVIRSPMGCCFSIR